MVHAGFRDDHDMFTQGACWVLAQEVNRITGWPLCAFWYPGLYLNGNDWDEHVFAWTPAGTYLDIRGEHSGPALCALWGAKQIKPLPGGYDFTAEGWHEPDFYSLAGCRVRARALAPSLVAPVLARMQKILVEV